MSDKKTNPFGVLTGLLLIATLCFGVPIFVATVCRVVVLYWNWSATW